MYKLKSVGLFLNWRCVDVLFLNVAYALWPLM